MILLYQIALLLASPLLLLWMVVRAAGGRLPGWRQRWGSLGSLPPASAGPRVWLHAVSLGEVKVASTLAAELRHRQPELQVILTTSTSTGQQEARRLAAASDWVLFPPFDLAWVCRRFLRRLRPDAILVVETEFWPNLFRQAHRAGVPLLIVNGRISDRSWPRYAATRAFWSTVMESITAAFPSGQTDAERFRALGVSQAQLRPVCNLKYRLRAAPPKEGDFLTAAASQLARLPDGQVIVAGSTMEGEEQILLQAFQELRTEFPALRLIIAPRHPERFDAVAALFAQAGLSVDRRSAWRPGSPIELGRVLLLDTTGELAAVYGLATVAFVGGTLVPRGGHNILEPAALGIPAVIGPSMENFREIADRFLRDSVSLPLPAPASARATAVVQIEHAASLAPALRYLFANPAQARQIGERARLIVESDQSGYAALCDEILAALSRRPATK